MESKKNYDPTEHYPTSNYPKRCDRCGDWFYKNGQCISCGNINQELYLRYSEKVSTIKENKMFKLINQIILCIMYAILNILYFPVRVVAWIGGKLK